MRCMRVTGCHQEHVMSRSNEGPCQLIMASATADVGWDRIVVYHEDAQEDLTSILRPRL